jgi:hypothetical protein
MCKINVDERLTTKLVIWGGCQCLKPLLILLYNCIHNLIWSESNTRVRTGTPDWNWEGNLVFKPKYPQQTSKPKQLATGQDNQPIGSTCSRSLILQSEARHGLITACNPGSVALVSLVNVGCPPLADTTISKQSFIFILILSTSLPIFLSTKAPLILSRRFLSVIAEQKLFRSSLSILSQQVRFNVNPTYEYTSG